MTVKVTLTPVKTILTLELEGDPVEVERMIAKILEIANEKPSPEENPALPMVELRPAAPEIENELLNRSLRDCDFSKLARNTFTSLELQTIGDLVSRNADELLAIKGFGMTSLAEVRYKLKDLGLSLQGDT